MSGTPSFASAATVPPAVLADVFNAAFANYVVPFPTMDVAGWEVFARRQGIDLAQSRVVRHGDAVVAFAMITARSEQRSRISGMGARPDVRGSGVAAALLDDVAAASAARGDRLIELEAFASNERAVRLYRSRGFQIVGELVGFVVEPAQGLSRSAGVVEVPLADAARWASAFDRETSVPMPWQVCGEALLAAVGPIKAWRFGDAQLAFQDGETPAVISLLDRDPGQRDAVVLLGALRRRTPDRILRAPQLHRGDGAALAFAEAGWTRQAQHQVFMQRRHLRLGALTSKD